MNTMLEKSISILSQKGADTSDHAAQDIPSRYSSDAPTRAFETAGLTASALALVACGGGGELGSGTGAGTGTGTGTGTGGGSAAAPTSTEAARFLLHAQLSANDTDIADVQATGYSVWLDAQFARPITQTGWDWLMAKGYNVTEAKDATAPGDYMAWQQIIQSTDSMRKRVALALSEIFVVGIAGVSTQSRFFSIAAYWDILNTHAFGRYRALLEDITLNPAMGMYLNVKGNQKASTGRVPDENYAREVLQLFSIGLNKLNADGTNALDGAGKTIETYEQNDITQLARVFTGYDLDQTGSTAITNPLALRNRMVVNNNLHETGSSTFLGVTSLPM